MTREKIQEFTLRISQANSTEMVVILYEMLLSYTEEAKEAIKQENRMDLKEAMRKCRGCLKELLHSLNLEYEPAPALLQLYMFCIRKLAHSEFHRDLQDILDVEKVILPLCEAYRTLATQNSQGSVMNNSQAVYAGLTYGRNSLTENMTDQGFNRGMRV